MKRIAFNVHAMFGSPEQEKTLMAWLDANRPAVMLFMDNPEMMQRAMKVSPETLFIGRSWPDGFDAVPKTIEGFVGRFGKIGDMGAAIYMMNESGVTQANTDWQLQMSDEMLKRGWKGVFYNTSVGTPEPKDWVIALPMIKKIVDNRGKFFLGLHEYFDEYPWWMMDGVAFGPKLPEHLPPWGKFLVGRLEQVLNLCRTSVPVSGIIPTQYLNNQLPQIIITEFGADRMTPDKNRPPGAATTPAAAPYQFYGSPKGYRTWADVYRRDFPQNPPGKTYAVLCNWCENNIYSQLLDAQGNRVVLGETVFNYFHQPKAPTDNENWAGSDVEGDNDFMSAVNVYPPADPKPAGDGVLYRVQSITDGGYANMRLSHSILGQIVGRVGAGDSVTVYGDKVVQDGHTWTYMVDGSVEGWVSEYAVLVATTPVPPPPPPPPDPPPVTPPMTPVFDVKEFASFLERQAAYFEGLAADLRSQASLIRVNSTPEVIS